QPTKTAVRVERLDPDYSLELQGRLSKLEGAISKQRTVKFQYAAMSTGQESERTLNPYALFNDRGGWYVVGHDLERADMRTFRVSRIRGDIKFATRRERDFRVPTDFDIDLYRDRPTWQIGDLVGEARIEVARDTAWWVERAFGDDRDAEIPAQDLVERFHIPPEELEDHLSLLNLVNFGGGCYTVYAELEEGIVRVDKELYGDTFRASPRLTPLEARAIRLAL